MPVAAGTRLGPYEIVAPLGAGGMGEVYRAIDPRLRRTVAIKILPTAFAGDPARLRRFEQEALATAALSHPNILAVYDVGTHEGTPFVVSELLDGESLRERLAAGPLPMRKTVEYALEAARGLAAAHDKGIAHRDLKPENLFVTRDGHLKILDFGLAKLTHVDAAETALPTAAAETEPGMVLGTVGYMAPEQVRGHVADHRADIFAFGAILYEMLTGHRAFRGDSTIETMNAILKEDPAPLPETQRSTSPALDRIVTHCLEKNPEGRFQSAHDLAFDLQALSDLSGSRGIASTAAARSYARLRWSVGGLLVVVAATVGGFAVGRRSANFTPPSFQQLTFQHGLISAARIAADGHTVVYAAAWDGAPLEIFSTQPGSAESRPLGLAGADILATSSSGDLAVSLDRRFRGGFLFTGTLARVPLAGGAPREILEDVEFAEWSPDGGSLAVIREVEGRHRLEFPIGRVLYETAGWLSHVRISAQGDLIAFIDHPVRGDDGGRVATVDSTGRTKILSTEWLSVQGLAWSGEEVWFTATRSGGSRALYGTTLSGAVRLIARVAGGLTLQDVSRDGRVLMTRESARLGIAAALPGETAERDLSWLDWSLVRALSRDGRTLLFDETGEGGGPRHGVYLRKTDGSPAVRLGDGIGMDLSPDGKWAVSLRPAFDQIVLLPTGAGEPRNVASGKIRLQRVLWFPDGKRLLIAGDEPGRAARLYVQSLTGGEPRPITPEGISTLTPSISPDGTLVVARAADQQVYAYPVEEGRPRVLQGLGSEELIAGWSADGGSLYVYERARVPVQLYEVVVASGARRFVREIAAANASPLYGVIQLLLTPDAKSYAYTYPRTSSELFLVDGLK